MIKTHTGEIIKPTIFPDGTSQVWKIGEDNFRSPFATIEWLFESEAEFIHLAQLKTLFDAHRKDVHLYIPYLPYGRQDKKITNESTFSLWPFLNLIESLSFTTVTSFDVHPTDHNFGKKFIAIRPDLEIKKTILACSAETICFPDKGASTRYCDLINLPFIYAYKERDQGTGQIIKLNLIGDPIGQSVLIIDDICDGGATFVMLTEQLLSASAREVNLYVSHGLFTKGIDLIKGAGIKRIFTRNGEIK